jgi:hypothetical protein
VANTVWNASDKSANVTLTGSNLIATATSGLQGGVRAVDRQITGKFYWEYTCNTITLTTTGVGLAWSALALNGAPTAITVGLCALIRTGNVYVDGGAVSGIAFGTITSGTLVGIAFDPVARLVWFRLGAAGNWNTSASANPATGTGGIAVTGIGGGIPAYPMAWFGAVNDQVTANFGDTAFVGAVPSGFTSGFTAGVTSSTNAIATQSAVEHWLTTNPRAQVTQVALEQWATVTAALPSTQGARAMVLA